MSLTSTRNVSKQQPPAGRTRDISLGSATRRALLTGGSLALLAARAISSPLAAFAHPGSAALAASARRAPSPPAQLRAAARTARRADRALVRRARALRVCLRDSPRHCAKARRALQRAGTRLAAAERRLAAVSLATQRHARAQVSWYSRRAPVIEVLGQTLRWAPTPGVSKYVFVRKVPGQADQYSVITGTSITPPPVPGLTVSYSVRTAVQGSAWAKEVSISYPPAGPTPSPDPQTAPEITVSGHTLSWTAVASVDTYVLMSKAPNQAAHYSVVGATSVTPPPVPGATVSYAVRTAVEGSAWSSEVSVTYPAASPSGSTPSGGEAEAPGAGTFGLPFVKGINTNLQGWGVGNVPQIAAEMRSLGVSWSRESLTWADVEPERGVFHWSAFDAIVAAAQANGITVLPLAGTVAPSWASPTDAADFAAFVKAAVERYGPGTSANLQWWELWNEPYFPQFWGGRTPEPEAYARDIQAASEAAKSVAPSVKMLVAADYQDSSQTGGLNQWELSWIDSMFAAVPSLGQLIDGVAVHPYGDDPSAPLAERGGWKDAAGAWAFQRIDTIREKFLAHGVNVPFWITEEGWSTWEVSEATQAQNYSDLASAIAARPWIRALFPFCLREFQYPATNNQTGFGLLKFGSWEPKLAFTALQQGLTSLH
jgi:hypothetical protein